MLFKTKTICCDCNKPIVVMAPRTMKNCTGFTCNACIPADSAARDGINESIFTEHITLWQRFKLIVTSIVDDLM